MSRYLGFPDLPGLSDVIAGDVSLKNALVHVALPQGATGKGRLSYLPPGRRVPNPGELVASESVAAQIRQLVTAEADLVIIDTPPLFAVSDATALAAVVGSSAVVVRADRADRPTLEQLHGVLSSGAHHPVGVVLTGSWSRHRPYGAGYAAHDPEGGRSAQEESLALGNGSGPSRARAADPAS